MKNSILIIVILCFTIFSCKRKSIKENSYHTGTDKQYEEIVFLNKDFEKVIDSFIISVKHHSINRYDQILIYLQKDNNDTILRLENSPPFEEEDLRTILSYKNVDLYFYAPQDLDNKLSVFFKRKEKERIGEIEIDTVTVDAVYMLSYIINGNKIIRRKIPLELSTEAN